MIMAVMFPQLPGTEYRDYQGHFRLIRLKRIRGVLWHVKIMLHLFSFFNAEGNIKLMINKQAHVVSITVILQAPRFMTSQSDFDIFVLLTMCLFVCLARGLYFQGLKQPFEWMFRSKARARNVNSKKKVIFYFLQKREFFLLVSSVKKYLRTSETWSGPYLRRSVSKTFSRECSKWFN